MGRAAAIAYAREGADVAINYYPTEEPDAQEVIALIKAAGRKAIALPGDLREEAFCQKLVADAVNGLDGLDILVSNAGRQQSHIRCTSKKIVPVVQACYAPLSGSHVWERRSNSSRKRLNTAASSGFNSCRWSEIFESALTRSVRASLPSK
jgi:NAD(P)-dependent dehydrogenase (short-subunit alcohol dehydrogenase family)